MFSAFLCSFFFFNDTATTEIYTLSLHDALPISALDPEESDVVGRRRLDAQVAVECRGPDVRVGAFAARCDPASPRRRRDRKSTRLNSSHVRISYAVFCLKKKKIKTGSLQNSTRP